jgi:hypothetical protein
MSTSTRIKNIVGLSRELALLEDRIQELCEDRRGGTILISAPRGRGKTVLWQMAVKEAKRRSLSFHQVSIDIENAPRNYNDLLFSVQQPGFLPARVTTAGITLVKAFADAAVQFPIPWVSKFIIKFIGVLPEISDQLYRRV